MPFYKTLTTIDDVILLKPQVFTDNRGSFFESYNKREFDKLINLDISFVQDNHSISKKNVIRGLHYQIEKPQGKLIRVVKGSVFDVSVDLRQSSKTYGNVFCTYLNTSNQNQIWIPEGIAHGFMALTTRVELLYKTTDFWYPDLERCILWNDKKLDIKWPIKNINPIINKRDSMGETWENSIKF